jgi:hypothetical protein
VICCCWRAKSEDVISVKVLLCHGTALSCNQPSEAGSSVKQYTGGCCAQTSDEQATSDEQGAKLMNQEAANKLRFGAVAEAAPGALESTQPAWIMT